jgi:hypothetical protein
MRNLVGHVGRMGATCQFGRPRRHSGYVFDDEFPGEDAAAALREDGIRLGRGRHHQPR